MDAFETSYGIPSPGTLGESSSYAMTHVINICLLPTHEVVDFASPRYPSSEKQRGHLSDFERSRGFDYQV